MNQLAKAASPYLRQHAHNPVQWYPWGEEALNRAKQENKPILLSVGYSTCYWCHVMEREVFENASIAALMNEHFINIKIDREEHPDLDEIYMLARQLMTQEAGWPNNVFLTPDLKPFYAGGTYAPADQGTRPGFPRVLAAVSQAWDQKQDEVIRQSEEITGVITAHLSQVGHSVALDVGALARGTLAQLKHFHDPRAGGFFQAPKFPHEAYLLFLAEYYEKTRDDHALAMLNRTLHRMAAGGIYDHIGGGFHRYAVDKDWMVPHFEKMLYNQALMAAAFTAHHRITGDPYTGDTARSVLEFVGGPFTSPEGAFYSAIDAETDGVEGEYYAWNSNELAALLTPPQLAFLTDMYIISTIPAHYGMPAPAGGVLHAAQPLPAAAAARGFTYLEVAGHAHHIFNILLPARNARKAPRLDDKILVGWNGLMIAALAEGAEVFKQPSYRERAEKAAHFILTRCRLADGTLAHGFAGGGPQFPALLEDYAYLIKGLIALGKTEDATRLAQEADQHLWNAETGGYYSFIEQGGRIAPICTVDDGALPSPNAVMLQNLVALGQVEQAKKLVDAFSAHVSQVSPLQNATFVSGLMRLFPAQVKTGPGEGSMPIYSELVQLSGELSKAEHGQACEARITVKIAEGWHVQAFRAETPDILPIQIDLRGPGVAGLVTTHFPEVTRKQFPYVQGTLPVYTGSVEITASFVRGEGPVTVHMACQPCSETTCSRPLYATVTL